ncbi:hypothetical protein N7470_007963 [Penicillium chermesinum]|nr:hypothetical protein N7470_007963 [Penicillium chermesinum]
MATVEKTQDAPETPKNAASEVSVAVDKAEESSSTEAAGEPRLTGLRLAAVFTVLCLAVFLVALDNTIVVTAIPRITDEFQALQDVGWYGSSYLLTTCMFQLIFGKLYGYFPIKWVFLAGVVIFEIGSAICGAAPSSVAFIIGRAIAGLGASGIFQGAMVIIAYSVDPRKRPMYNGIFGSTYGISSIIGPLIGGLFTSHVTWRWCFYINLPIGGVVIAILVIFLQLPPIIKSESDCKTFIQHMDPLGIISFLPATLKLPENAMVPPRIIRISLFAYSSLFMIVFSGAYFTLLYYLPIWFQAIKGASAVNSGIMCLPMMLSMVIFSFITGGGVTATGKHLPFFILATVLSTIGAGLITTFETDTGHPKWIGYQVLVGAGIGLGVQLPVITAQAVLPAPDIPVGTAIMTFCQTFSGAIFVAVSQALFTNKLRSGILNTVPGVSPSIVEQIGATNLDTVIDAKHMPAVREVYNEALVSIWYLAVALFGVSVAVVGVMTLRARRQFSIV